MPSRYMLFAALICTINYDEILQLINRPLTAFPYVFLRTQEFDKITFSFYFDLFWYTKLKSSMHS